MKRLDRHGKLAKKPRARLASEILREGLARREAADARRRLAADYVAGRHDARAILADWEDAQGEMLDDEDH